jgi:hypothetical protein
LEEIKRYTYKDLIDKYGKPVFEHEFLPKDYIMTFEEEISDKPYKVAIFSNLKNALGFTICATYGRSEESEWHINAGDKWTIKQMLVLLDYTDKIVIENLQLNSDIANLQTKIFNLENEKQGDFILIQQNLEIMNKQLDRIHELEGLLTKARHDVEPLSANVV